MMPPLLNSEDGCNSVNTLSQGMSLN